MSKEIAKLGEYNEIYYSKESDFFPSFTNCVDVSKHLLLQGAHGEEPLVAKIQSGKISPNDVLESAMELFENGLPLDKAASVLYLLTSHGRRNNGIYGRYLSMIDRHPETEKHKMYRFDPDKTLTEARIDEAETRVIELLSRGNLSLFPHSKNRGIEFQGPNVYDRSIGIGLIVALSKIPEFRSDVRDWLNEVIKIPTTDGASLPHFFSYFLQAFNLYKPEDYNLSRYLEIDDKEECDFLLNAVVQQTVQKIKEIYENPESRRIISRLKRLSHVNTETGDTYIRLDENTLPIIGRNFGSNPKWLELAMSRGVVWKGTLQRAKKIGINPIWMFADLYHPEELWEASLKFMQIANEEDPYSSTSGYSASGTQQAKQEIGQIFEDPNYRGFIRANFEEFPSFTEKVLYKWKLRTGFPFPDVVRMTGVCGMTEQSMKNLLSVVNPNGGVLILSEGNDTLLPRNMMWQIFRNETNVVTGQLLHSGDYVG